MGHEIILLILFLIAVVVLLVEIRKSKRQGRDPIGRHLEREPEVEVTDTRLRHALLVGRSPSLATVAFNLKMVERYDVVETVEDDEAVDRLAELIRPSAEVVAVVDLVPEDQRAVEFVRAVRSEPEFDSVRIVGLVPELQTDEFSSFLASMPQSVTFLLTPFSTEALREKLRLLRHDAPKRVKPPSRPP